MGIFIRSQDKKRLIEANIFDIYVADEGIRIEASTEKHTYFLGTYSTEEKALKVLDMIQEHIAGAITITTELIKGADGKYMVVGNNNLEETIKRSVPTTFNMPQDEEVK